MWANRIKALGVGLAALLVLALVAPVRGQAKKLEKPDEKPKPPALPVFVFGTVKEVSADGKTVTVAPGPFSKEKEDRKLQLGDRTVVRFNMVAPGEAGVRKGYHVFATLPEKGSSSPTRVEFTGASAGKGQLTFVSGMVSAVGEGGRSLTITPLAKGKAEKPKDVTVKITPKTMQVFNNVGPGDAELVKGMSVFVGLAGRARDTATQAFLGGAGKFPIRKEKWAYAGKVVAVGAGGKSITVQPATLKKDRPAPVELKLGPASRQVFALVRRGGARPEVGYNVRVWVDEKDKDTVSLATYSGAPQSDPYLLFGTVTAVAPDGKSFTLHTFPVKFGDKGREARVKLAGDTVVLLSNVPPGGDRVTVGSRVTVRLSPDSEDTAEVAIFTGADAPAPKPAP